MKKTLILSLLAVGLAGCESAKRVPYNGVGEYGYTFDLDNSPSPFRDTGYHPLTARDLREPIRVIATNEVALSLINQQIQADASAPALTNVVAELEVPAETNVPPVIPKDANTNSSERVVPLPSPQPPATTNETPATPPVNPEEKKPADEKPVTPP
ncbi:MAG: hypothetical protein ABJC04_00015 [Verrucomicrobiota bacterium]